MRNVIVSDRSCSNTQRNDRRIKNEGIAVVSFPRVGNTYAGRVIKRGGNNKKLKFVHHYHSAAEAINSSNVLKPSTSLILNTSINSKYVFSVHKPNCVLSK